LRKTIVIGASSGIGKCIAEKLLASGEFVVLCARRKSLLEEIHSRYPETSVVEQLDVNDTVNSLQNLKRIFNYLQQVDWLILSSGIGDFNAGLDFDIEKNTIDTNVYGFTAIVDCVYNLFKIQGFGQLAAISSVGGLRGGAGSPAYNASKAYQVNYLEALQIKAVKDKVPVYVTDIRPGFVDTEMAKGEAMFWVVPVTKAADQIIRAISKRRKVAYISRRWGLIAFIISRLPFSLYSRF
jgi:short-subunit dehydrogenase